MKFFEKNLNDRFKDASSLEGIDADDLWNQIESEVSEKPSKKSFFYFWKKRLFLLIPLFFLIGGLGWYQLSYKSSLKNTETITSKNQIQSNIESADLESANVERKPSSKTKDENPVITNNEIISNNNKITKKINDANSTVFNETQTKDGILNSNEFKQNTNSKISSNKITKQEEGVKDQINFENKKNTIIETSKESSLISNISTQEDNDERTNFASNNNLNENPEKSNVVNNLVNQKDKDVQINLANNTPKEPGLISDVNIVNTLSKIQEVAELTSLPFALLKVEEEILDLRNLYLPLSKSRFRLGAFVGMHTVKNNFSTDLSTSEERKNILNNGFEYELGQTYSVELSYQLRKNVENLYFKSGIEYVKSVSEFNLFQTWDTTMVNPNSPVGSITDATARRTIVHHNEMKFLSIPLMIAFQKSTGKMEFGVSGGVGLNFTKSQTGKSLNFNDDISLYPNNDNTELPVSSFFLSYQFRPYLNYGICRNTFIQLRADVRYQNYGKSDFYGLNYSSILMGVGVGLEHKF